MSTESLSKGRDSLCGWGLCWKPAADCCCISCCPPLMQQTFSHKLAEVACADCAAPADDQNLLQIDDMRGTPLSVGSLEEIIDEK